MKRIRVLALVVTIAVVGASARPAAAATDNTSRNILIGALIGAGVGLVVGLIVYLAKDKSAPAAASLRNPPGWSAVGLRPLPPAPAVHAARDGAAALGALLRF